MVLPLLASAQPDELWYTHYEQNISVNPAKNTFTRHFNIKAKCSKGVKIVESIPYGELDQIKNLSVRYSKNGKWIKLKKKTFKRNSIHATNAFFTGLKVLSFEIEAQDQDFELEYSFEKHTTEMMLLAHITVPKNSDHFTTSINLPENYVLSYDKKASESFQVDQQTIAGLMRYQFSISNQPTPALRLIVHHIKKDAADYFNDWYRELIRPNSILNQNTKEQIYSLTQELTTDLEKIKAIFDFVKEKINYIAIENGLGAIQARNVNQTLLNKHGDCKDMSLLLCQSLRLLGFDANIALSATVNHAFDLDFPSLASANHAICVLRYNDEEFYLDPTEEKGFFGWPSRQIQGKQIFIINEDAGQIKKLEAIPAEKNIEQIKFNLQASDRQLKGKVSGVINGFSKISLLSTKRYHKKPEQATYNYLINQFPKCSFDQINVQEKEKAIHFNHHIETAKILTSIKNKTYLSLDFLTLPNDLSTVKFQTQHKVFDIAIKFDHDFSLAPHEAIDFEKSGIAFNFFIEKKEANVLYIHYNYRNEHIQLSESLIPVYKEALAKIKTVLAKPIVYEELP